jgi:hypothetical protein
MLRHGLVGLRAGRRTGVFRRVAAQLFLHFGSLGIAVGLDLCAFNRVLWAGGCVICCSLLLLWSAARYRNSGPGPGPGRRIV